MSDKLKVALIQFSPTWENSQETLQQLDQSFLELDDDIDLVLLPEMFNTGFSMKPENTAEEINGITVKWLKEKSKKFHIAASLAFKEDDHYYNRIVVAYNDAILGKYDKNKLFSMAKEDEVFKAGKEQLHLNIGSLSFAFFICYDLRFPELMRNKTEYDVAVILASWPKKRIHHWNTLLQARAIENQSYVLGVNRIGEDGNGFEYSGASQVIEPNGQVVKYLEQRPGVVYHEISKEVIQNTRTKLPFLKDQ